MIKLSHQIFTLLAVALLLFSCGGPTNTSTLDLMSYGLPIAINAPEGAEVVLDDLGVWKDVTVKKGNDYFIQILSSKATSLDVSKLKSESLTEVKGGRFFSKIIQEDDAGFVFEKKIDDTVNYDFRYFKIQGDSEYSFQTGLIGTFTEEQVRTMYKSVK